MSAFSFPSFRRLLVAGFHSQPKQLTPLLRPNATGESINPHPGGIRDTKTGREKNNTKKKPGIFSRDMIGPWIDGLTF
jgi:hypothetical protein